MRVAATNLDGQPLGDVDLARSEDGRATVNDQAVLSTRPIGGRIALIVGPAQYCVAIADYLHVMSAAGGESHGSAG